VIAGILMDIKTWGYFDFGAEAISNTEFRRSKTGWLRSLSFALTDSSPDEKAIQLAENVDFEQKDSIKPLVTHLMNRKNHAGERMASLKIHSILSHYLQFENNKGLGSSIPLKEGLLKSYQQKGVDVNQTMFGHHGADGIQADSKLLKFLIEDLEVNIDQILDAPYKVALNELQKYVTKAKEISPLAQKIEGVPGTGIFYHFAMLTGTTNSFYRSPPKTAAAVIEKFGCQHIGSPEDVPDLDPEDIKPPVIDPNLTITQNFNDATSQSNACLSCHKVMNRYSDVLQQVNAVGEVTDQEVFYDQSGMATHQHSLDTFANLNLHGQFFVAKNFYDFPKIFQETGSFALCVAKEAVKTLYLNNDEKKLACEIKSGFEQLMNKSTKVNEILELMIEQPNFQKINIDPER
jgi:hypothetical protein